MTINQTASIGDILFLEPMFRYFWKKNREKPIVPLREHLMWLSNYITSADFRPLSQCVFDSESLEVTHDYLPTRWANQIVRGFDKDHHWDFENCMLDKYLLAKLEPAMWKGIRLEFDFKKAEYLMLQIGAMEQSGLVIEYCLVNEYSQAGKITIEPKTDLPIIRMRQIEGFTLVDWFLAIQMATENHHVSTSTFYLMQAICNQFIFDSKVFIYPRPNADGLRGISKLITSFEWKAVN